MQDVGPSLLYNWESMVQLGATLALLVNLSLGVLVSAGIELIFFLEAGTVLCFGFSVRIMLITL